MSSDVSSPNLEGDFSNRISSDWSGNGTVDSLPLTTKSRVLSITELVCAILSRCVGVAGIGPFNPRGNDEMEEEEMKKQNINSPKKELEVRRERVLAFKAKDSPWRVLSQIERQGTEDRGRRKEGKGVGEDLEMEQSKGQEYPHLQATLLRSARSTSRSQSRPPRSDNKTEDYNVLGEDIDMAESNPPTSKLEEAREGLEEDEDIISANLGILKILLDAIECGFGKTQEAALWTLAELMRENSNAGISLFRLQTSSGLLPTSMLLNLRKEPSASLRLAAFSW